MKKPKDKRTKEYKYWKANFDARPNDIGLGDVIENITSATGIKKVVELFIDGEDCGCDKRKEKLNKIKLKFPIYRCFTEDLYNQWTEFRKKRIKGSWKGVKLNHQDKLFEIEVTKHLFVKSFKPCSRCGTALKDRIEQIDKIYKQYK